MKYNAMNFSFCDVYRALTKKSIVWLKYVRGLAIGAAVTGGLTIIFTVIGYWQARAIYASTVAALLTGKINQHLKSLKFSHLP